MHGRSSRGVEKAERQSERERDGSGGRAELFGPPRTRRAQGIRVAAKRCGTNPSSQKASSSQSHAVHGDESEREKLRADARFSLQGIEARSVYISCNCLCILRGLACVSTTHRHALHREREEEGYLTQCQLWPCLGFLSARLGRSALRLYSAPCNHAACACIYGSFSLAWRSVQCACAFFLCPCRVMSYVDRRDRVCAWDERAVISG
jgi:hypothetical protein